MVTAAVFQCNVFGVIVGCEIIVFVFVGFVYCFFIFPVRFDIASDTKYTTETTLKFLKSIPVGIFFCNLYAC